SHVEPGAHARRRNWHDLPVEKDEHQNGWNPNSQLGGFGCLGQAKNSVGCEAPEPVPDGRGHRVEYRAAAPAPAHAQHLCGQNRGNHNHSNRSRLRFAPTIRTNASSRDSPPDRSSSAAPAVTILPPLIIANRSHRRSTTSSTWDVRKIVAPRRTWSIRMSFIR